MNRVQGAVFWLGNSEEFSKGLEPMLAGFVARFGAFIAGLILALSAEARVFNFGQETTAPYFKMRAGQSNMGRAPLSWQSVPNLSGDEIELTYGGEFGFYWRGGGFGVAAGVLVQTFDSISGARGLNGGGTELYRADSEGITYGPSLTFDFQFYRQPQSLWKVFLGGGYQYAELDNLYQMTAAGQALSGGQQVVLEKYVMESPFATFGVAAEFLLSGTTTMSLEVGYHHCFEDQWSYGQGGQNFTGVVNQGADVRFEDGSFKRINLSYPFLQVGFQFYVDTIR